LETVSTWLPLVVNGVLSQAAEKLALYRAFELRARYRGSFHTERARSAAVDTVHL